MIGRSNHISGHSLPPVGDFEEQIGNLILVETDRKFLPVHQLQSFLLNFDPSASHPSVQHLLLLLHYHSSIVDFGMLGLHRKELLPFLLLLGLRLVGLPVLGEGLLGQNSLPKYAKVAEFRNLVNIRVERLDKFVLVAKVESS